MIVGSNPLVTYRTHILTLNRFQTMGSASSSSPDPAAADGKSRDNGVLSKEKSFESDTTKSREVNEGKSLVRTNQVAPIIIKNCKEEFQHVTDIKDPIVYGRVADGMLEHALLQSKYFLVYDTQPSMDTLNTIPEYLAPNFSRASGYPVYGMGQPTKDGLTKLLTGIKTGKDQMILLFNLRSDPVLFVREIFDMVPYSPRHVDDLKTYVQFPGATVQQITEMEALMRKEVIDLAAFKDDQHFYFYKDIETWKDEPHTYRTAYEDDIAVTEEIYSRLTFSNPGIRYVRMCWPNEGAPTETDFDTILSIFRNVPDYFNPKDSKVPSVIFTSHNGLSRSTMGMVIGVLLLARKRRISIDPSKYGTIDPRAPKLDRGEYHVIQQLIKCFPNGTVIKKEVDAAIDMCTNLKNIRLMILGAKNNLEGLNEQDMQKARSALRTLIKQLEIYYYLICFNAYLHEQYSLQFGELFSHWVARHSYIYDLMRVFDVTERQVPLELLSSKDRFLVADDFLGLDVLSSHMDVKTSNFRRVPGLPVYGMAQPNLEGLGCVVNHLLSKKINHSSVVWFNLREDMVIEINGSAYSIRDSKALDEPCIMPEISQEELEEKESELKKLVQEQKQFEVYRELDQSPVSLNVESSRTCRDMYQDLVNQDKPLIYHRIPTSDDSAPTEKVFDKILSLMNGITELQTDEDGPALVFQCRTGKGRTTTAMAIAGLVICHKRGFPYGTKIGEEERVSLPNAKYTQGHYNIVQEVVRRIPDGHQVKREVDFILNQCSDTMTPMHYHIREIIFVTYNKMKKAKTPDEQHWLKKRGLDYLERYIYLILFNTYLHCERRNKWATSFSVWMKEVAANAGMYEILDNLCFSDFEQGPTQFKTRRSRRSATEKHSPIRGQFL